MLESVYSQDTVDALVRRVFRVDDVTLGSQKQPYLVRYRGHLISEDSAAAYDLLCEYLKPHNLTPLFRWDGDRHAILLIPRLEKPKPSNPKINLILFIITLISVWVSGSLYGLHAPLPEEPLQAVWAFIKSGFPFAITMIVVLGSHEFGHYLAGRFHGVHVTLPYFIPLPLSQFGTMGAFINMKEPPKNRRQLLDIGLAGPLAGVLVAIPALLIGLYQSKLDPLPTGPLGSGMALSMEGNSLLYLFLKYIIYGQLLPAPVDYGNLSPVLYWIRYFFTGRPFPYGGMDVLIGPVAFAAWAGLLVTGLNLIPAGQLDGGHVIYTLLGSKTSRRIYPFILAALAVLGFFWPGWWLWVVLLFFLIGRRHAEPLDQITPLDARRRLMALLGMGLFLLTFTPVPLLLIS